MFGELYRAYLKEREGLDVLEVDHGFMVYKIGEREAWISDYYVHPDHREKGIGHAMADCVLQVCKDRGVGHVYCQIDHNANGVELSKLTIERYGFERAWEEGSLVIYKMEVATWGKK